MAAELRTIRRRSVGCSYSAVTSASVPMTVSSWSWRSVCSVSANPGMSLWTTVSIRGIGDDRPQVGGAQVGADVVDLAQHVGRRRARVDAGHVLDLRVVDQRAGELLAPEIGHAGDENTPRRRRAPRSSRRLARPCSRVYPRSSCAPPRRSCSSLSRPCPTARSTSIPTAELAPRALLPGDPGRALMLAQHLLVEPAMFNHNRGLWGYTRRREGRRRAADDPEHGHGRARARRSCSRSCATSASRSRCASGVAACARRGSGSATLVVADAVLSADGTSRALGAARAGGARRGADAMRWPIAGARPRG